MVSAAIGAGSLTAIPRDHVVCVSVDLPHPFGPLTRGSSPWRRELTGWSRQPVGWVA